MFTLHKQGSVKVIVAMQSLTRDTVPHAEAVCTEALAQGQPRIVFDMRAAALLDSAGVEMLLGLRDRCVSKGGSLHLAAPNALCRDILTATHVVNEFVLFDNALAAVGSFAQ